MTLYNLYPAATAYEPTSGDVASAPESGVAAAAAAASADGDALPPPPPEPLQFLTLPLWAFQYERGSGGGGAGDVGSGAAAAAALSLRNVTLVVPAEELQLLQAALRQLGKLPPAASSSEAADAPPSAAESGTGSEADGTAPSQADGLSGGGGGRRQAQEVAAAVAATAASTEGAPADDCVSDQLLTQLGGVVEAVSLHDGRKGWSEATVCMQIEHTAGNWMHLLRFRCQPQPLAVPTPTHTD